LLACLLACCCNLVCCVYCIHCIYWNIVHLSIGISCIYLLESLATQGVLVGG
jgi:hypothetical protein